MEKTECEKKLEMTKIFLERGFFDEYLRVRAIRDLLSGKLKIGEVPEGMAIPIKGQ
jgi:hypothetical protein